MFLLLLHMFFQVFGNDIAELPHGLQQKIDLLPQLLVESKSSNTTRTYYAGFIRWTKWAATNGLNHTAFLPAKPIHVALYLASLVQLSRSPSPIIQAYYSINWAHSITGTASPTDSSLVKNILEGAKRQLAVAKNRKEPITPEILEKLFDSTYNPTSLYCQRTITACLMAFSGFLRISELLNLRRTDIDICDTHMCLNIETSKTDVYRDGACVVIARSTDKMCPVKNLELYLDLANIQADSDLFLFQSLNKGANGYCFRSTNKPLTYTRMRELFIEGFSPFVADISKFGLHSLRSGGATAAVSMGIPDRLFKRHGRWKSESAKDAYVKDSLEARLLVSKNLGI